MKILHLDEQKGWRGGEQQASWLIQASAEKGHGIWIAGREGSQFLQSDHGGAEINRLALPFWAEFDVYTSWRLAQLVYDEEIDVIHAHTSHTHAIACITRKLAQQGTVVVSRRVGFPPRQDVLNRWKYGAPDAYIAVSNMVGEVLLEAGIPQEKVRCVHSAVDLARLDVEAIPREAVGVPEGAPLLFSAGALVGHKDHANLIRAMANVHEKRPEARLLIAGEGDLRASLEAQIAEASLEEVITLLGHRDDVPALVRAADCYVSSSWSEGLGTSILEALAAGTPVVAAKAGGAAEMVRPGETGHLVPSRDPEALAEAILASLADTKASARMAKAGRKLVESEFNVEAMVDGTLAVYVETVARVKGFTE